MKWPNTVTVVTKIASTPYGISGETFLTLDDSLSDKAAKRIASKLVEPYNAPLTVFLCGALMVESEDLVPTMATELAKL